MPDNLHRAAWITWEIQPRNRSMAKAMGVPLHELIINKPRAIKYPALIWKTLALIIRKKLNIVFVQNPSIVLSFITIIYAQIRNIKVIVDAHNAGIFPLEGKSRFLNAIAKFIARKATVIIVSNQYLAGIIETWGGAACVMPDPIPDAGHSTSSIAKNNPPYIYFICTWAEDEPYREVIEAAKHIPGNLEIHITGNYQRKLSEQEIKNIPANVRLLGFIPEKDYADHFKNSLAALDLTTREHCLVCGAYEALAFDKPCIISDSVINREVFERGFFYTKNDCASIAEAITTLSLNIAQYEQGIKEQKILHIEKNRKFIDLLKARIFQ